MPGAGCSHAHFCIMQMASERHNRLSIGLTRVRCCALTTQSTQQFYYCVRATEKYKHTAHSMHCLAVQAAMAAPDRWHPQMEGIAAGATSS